VPDPLTQAPPARPGVHATAGERTPLRVAIVGLGPKGLFALERLLDHAGRTGHATHAGRAGSPPAIEVDAFEPHPVPGAGPVYDPRQPAHLRMNFAADQVDAWWPGTTAVPPSRRRSFVDWSHDRGEPCPGGSYPPRADVGRYLADVLRDLLAHPPAGLTVRLIPTRVQSIWPDGAGWALTAAGRSRVYDEVLIATGHDRSPNGPLEPWSIGPATVVPAVFPVDRWLSTARIPPGATVAIRGFALSFIDAALTLTEGRGGRFEPLERVGRDCPEADGSAPPGTRRLRYRPGGEDAGVIFPFSRTGRPMLAKPAAARPGLDRIAARGRRLISRLGPGLDLRRDLLPILSATARANLLAARAGPLADDRLEEWLDAAAAGLPVAPDRPPADEIRRSLEVGGGRVAPDLSWALGQTWRGVYPAVVDGLSGDRLSAADWPAFRRLAAELERVSFGPPPVNAAKLLALIEAGRVDLTHVRGGLPAADRGRTVLRSGGGEQAVDIVVDAVLPGPGAPGAGDPLLRRLLRDGHARIAAGRRGIDVDVDGSCRAADLTLTPGLAAIGRPTEDSVIGNDTLSRTLHPQADRWARRVVERAASVGLPGRSASVGVLGR
jgi:uncharacterized NAD(P)/FAD-binding protein YdhS